MASPKQKEISIKEKLSKLQCPFTWNIKDSVIKYDTIYNAHMVQCKDEGDEDDESSCSLEMLIKFLLECYKAVINANDDDAGTKMKKAEKVLVEKIEKEQELRPIIRTIKHVFYATKCFFLYETDKMDETAKILENIVDTDNFDDVEKGALYGCESVVWSFLHDFGAKEATETATKAVEMNKECALWHFILAKNLRRQRRSISMSSQMSGMEERHFELAYRKSKNPIFGMYYLQMCFEKFYPFNRDREYLRRKAANEEKVLHEAKQFLMTKPTNYKVLLRLTLMFLRARNTGGSTLTFAKECLDAVQEIAPDSPVYLHYMAMFYEKRGNVPEALSYYEKAANSNNFVAELVFVEYKWKYRNVDPLSHLLQMSEKYKGSIKERQIQLLLAFAVTYYTIYQDIPNAAEYFLKALIVDPLNKKFKGFYKFLNFKEKDISLFLKHQFLSEALAYQKKNPGSNALEQTCQKIKDLLNGKNIDDLSGKFGAMSMDSK